MTSCLFVDNETNVCEKGGMDEGVRAVREVIWEWEKRRDEEKERGKSLLQRREKRPGCWVAVWVKKQIL